MPIDEKYLLYEQLLKEWNQKMNLVSPGTLDDVRGRHIDDSAQLAKYIPQNKIVVDLGSGAGFPGVVLAILGFEVIAVESIEKKCRFLGTLASKLNLPNLKILNERVEKAVPNIIKNAKNRKNLVFTARAFAPLIRILDLTKKLDNFYVLLKGRQAKEEIAAARAKHKFEADLYPSETGDGFIIKLTTK
ncbi:MAG: 16S rRNA (guanine(527)-N(7))-methyltransferase RsmG [Rickettsiales bacterium]|jgi:16S rRNA (guanine527-N7)-methyltransferase|nr:16S rRNA (guanine(527)-N(7))-methyltransferase RsmG [Rickettsiales bacterium]